MSIPELRIRLFPVGLGDAILVHFPDASWALIDCGWTDQGDTAQKVLTFLNHEKPSDTPVRFVLATHPDNDHVGRIRAFLAQCPRKIEAFYHCGVARGTADGATTEKMDYLSYAHSRSARGLIGPVRVLQDGEEVPLDPPIEGLAVVVLNPDKKTVERRAARSASARNNAAVVLQITYGGVHILLPSDIESAAWKRVVEAAAFHPPHVLKVSHHGARNGIPPVQVSEAIPDRGPRWALLSTPSDEKSKPHPEVLTWFWDKPGWRTRCTGWSSWCETGDQEPYPVETGATSYPVGLMEALGVQGKRGVDALGTHLGCCVNNEIVVRADGTVCHSHDPAAGRAKSCDRRIASAPPAAVP
jgi:beta-lactamase superfamily II metal-dependent hydrolase